MLKATSVGLSGKTKRGNRDSLGFLLPHFYFIFCVCMQSFRAHRCLKMEVESLSFNLILMLTASHSRAPLSATFFHFFFFLNAGLKAEGLYWVCWWETAVTSVHMENDIATFLLVPGKVPISSPSLSTVKGYSLSFLSTAACQSFSSSSLPFLRTLWFDESEEMRVFP